MRSRLYCLLTVLFVLPLGGCFDSEYLLFVDPGDEPPSPMGLYQCKERYDDEPIDVQYKAEQVGNKAQYLFYKVGSDESKDVFTLYKVYDDIYISVTPSGGGGQTIGFLRLRKNNAVLFSPESLDARELLESIAKENNVAIEDSMFGTDISGTLDDERAFIVDVVTRIEEFPWSMVCTPE